jgi:hypothetical protein
LLCIERGHLVFVISNVMEEQYVERLVRDGVLGTTERAALAREAERGGKKIGALILESGLISEDNLRSTAAAHILELTLDCMKWPDGRFRFDPGKPSIEGEVTGEVSIADAVLRHTSTHPAGVDAVRVRIGPPDLQVYIDPSALGTVAAIADDPTLAHVVEAASTPTAVATLVEGTPSGPEATLRAIHGLLLLRVLRRGDTVSTAAAASASATEKERRAVSREEIEGWLSRSRDATHYEILDVDSKASIEEIRSGYYRHARRFHPDRLRSGPFQDLLPRIEVFFSRVTEAHNTIGDPGRRREYDRFLVETGGRTQDSADSNTAFVARQNFLRGKAAAERRRFGEAVSFLENAIKMDDQQAEFRLELGRVLMQNPRHRPAAEEHIRAAAEMDPSNPEVYLALADLYGRLDRPDDVLRALRETLRWDPGNKTAIERLRGLGHGPDGGDGGLFGGLFGR